MRTTTGRASGKPHYANARSLPRSAPLYGKERLVFERSLSLAKELGLLDESTEQIVDSTPMLGAAAVQDTATLVRSGVRKLIDAVRASDAQAGQELESGLFFDYSRARSRRAACSDPRGVARDQRRSGRPMSAGAAASLRPALEARARSPDRPLGLSLDRAHDNAAGPRRRPCTQLMSKSRIGLIGPPRRTICMDAGGVGAQGRGCAGGARARGTACTRERVGSGGLLRSRAPIQHRRSLAPLVARWWAASGAH